MPTGHDFLSPRDFGRAIGVSESTVKRWVDSGELRVMRTPGRHRRIVLSDAVRFVRDHQCRIQDPGLLGMDQTPLPPRPGDDLATQIHDALVSGDEVRLRQRVLGAYLSGMSVHALGDGPVRIAFARIGELWKHDDDGIAIEHQAVQAMMRLMGMLRRLVEGRWLTAHGVVGLYPANSVNDDDIEVYADESRTEVLMTWRGLRMQTARPVVDGVKRPNRCLADFVAPRGSGVADHIGLFAVTTAGISFSLRGSMFLQRTPPACPAPRRGGDGHPRGGVAAAHPDAEGGREWRAFGEGGDEDRGQRLRAHRRRRAVLHPAGEGLRPDERPPHREGDRGRRRHRRHDRHLRRDHLPHEPQPAGARG